MKLLGAMLILTASLSLADRRCRMRRRRMAALAQMTAAISAMEAELAGRAAPLPAPIAQLAGQSYGAGRRFFSGLSGILSQLGQRSFRSLWEAAVYDALPELHGREQEALCRLGAALGRYPMEHQLAALSGCLVVLREEEQALRLRYREDRRLIWGMHAAAGILLWIVLL